MAVIQRLSIFIFDEVRPCIEVKFLQLSLSGLDFLLDFELDDLAIGYLLKLIVDIIFDSFQALLGLGELHGDLVDANTRGHLFRRS